MRQIGFAHGADYCESIGTNVLKAESPRTGESANPMAAILAVPSPKNLPSTFHGIQLQMKGNTATMKCILRTEKNTASDA